MRRYNYTKPLNYITTSPQNMELVVQEPEIILPENIFAKTAYEWNNALRIAAEKMLGGHPTV